MTRKVGNMFIIEEETDGPCELCGDVSELRPYGPNGENVCFPCGMKDEPAAMRQLIARLIGPSEETQH